LICLKLAEIHFVFPVPQGDRPTKLAWGGTKPPAQGFAQAAKFELKIFCRIPKPQQALPRKEYNEREFS
jgi:hypothetical protein